jgi:dolichol-phosphate mannosyltransferase
MNSTIPVVRFDPKDSPTFPPRSRVPQLVSIVVPVFREESGLVHFTETLIRVLQKTNFAFEILFVEDDSPDATLMRIRELHARFPSFIRALSLSRRFGHQPSLAAGLEFAAGDVVICMDGDLQHPPEMIPLLLSRWAIGDQLVYTRRLSQAGRSPAKELASRTFYRMMNWLSEVPFEEGTADFRLMDRVVVDSLRQCDEVTPIYRGLVQWIGFRRTVVEFHAPERFAGTSSYSWRRMFRLAAEAVFAFSLRPLRVAHAAGASCLLLTSLYALYTVICWLFGGIESPGYTSLVLLVSFLGGLQMLCLGVVGEYIGRIHEQVKNRPRYLIKEQIGFSCSGQSRAA